jgi:L-lactate permease
VAQEQIADEALAATFSTNWLSAAGTIIVIADIIALAVLRVGPGRALRIYGQTLNQLKWAILTIASILGLAYLLNYSGVTYTLGLAFAATGVLFPFFASFIGWLGVALTGSDTSSNALFANLQKVTAQQIGVSPVLTVGANSSGGVLGKMISPQNLAVGTSATRLQGQEGDLLRVVLKWSIGLTIVMAIDGDAPGLRAPVHDPWLATLLKESVRSCRIATVMAVTATAVHVGSRVRLRMVAATKNSSPSAAWSPMLRATRALPPAPRASGVARKMPRKITRLPASREAIRTASSAAWYASTSSAAGRRIRPSPARVRVPSRGSS